MPQPRSPATVSFMIGYLSGIVKVLPQTVVVVAGGVGYRVHTPEHPVDGSAVEWFVTTVVREDAFNLYAFGSAADQQLFDALCSITGVGPSSALALLRDVGAGEIARAVRTKDHRVLTRAKGVGAKVAERIVSMINLPADLPATETVTSEESDAISALEALGYDRGRSRIAVAAAREHGAHDTTTLVTDALGALRAG